MPFLWRIVCVLIFIFILSGCQTTASVDSQLNEPQLATDDNDTADEDEPFHPYEDVDVPQLKTLIFAEGFKEYTTEQPYLLGYSYDGDYVATIIYDNNQEGYIVEVTDTLVNRIVYEAFVPDADRILKGEQVSIDLLSTAQESLDMGYRIKVAPVVNEQTDGSFEQRGAEKEVYNFQMSVVEDKWFRIIVRDEKDHTWFVVDDPSPLNSEQTFMHHYTWAIHPQVPDRVNVMVYTAKKGQPVTPYVYTVNTSVLDRQMSEQGMQKTLSEWLDQPKIVYRLPSTANARAVLAVGSEGEKSKDASPLYTGNVTQFALLDREGKMLIHANDSGVYDAKDQKLDQNGEPLHFEVMLLPGTNKRDAELFVVDVYGQDNDLLQTLEWEWSDQKGKFQYIQPEETT